jgi:hypothetical protein
MQVKDGHIRFNEWHSQGPRELEAEVIFDTPVTQATAILTGFDVAFTREDGDHHLGNLEVRLDAEIDRLAPQRVNVVATYGLRDWSEEWDDHYEGEVFFTVVAE